MSYTEFNERDLALIAADWEELKELSRNRCANDKEFQTVEKAFEFANHAHKNVRRRSGEPYMLHPIAVAKIVIQDIGLGYKSICAALLHDVVEDTDYTTEDIKNLFGEKISVLVDGLTKIKTVLDNEDKSRVADLATESLQAENFKRILLTMNDDVRVVLIKLADRLHNCRTIEYMPEYKRDKILSETMFIFIPLAHRLGLYSVKSEMENIWLRYKEPEAYYDITSQVNLSLQDREQEIDDFIKPIENSLKNAGFDFKILKRVKTPYSIWHKMQTKNVSFEQVYDLYAVRIVFTPPVDSTESERDQCYHIFSIITGLYRYQSSRVRDWVKHPKSNGYEALHCTLMSQTGIWVEVQIRSKRMDDIAEKGIAAHWAYKREGFISENASEMDEWLSKVKDILTRQDVNAMELLDMIHGDLVSTDIVVFTPKGKQVSIQKGATALDFAFVIHTDIGKKAIAAKVNMKLVPLSQELKSGDQVEIITAQNGHPNREWLKFLKTRRAIGLVTDYFKPQRDELIKEGASVLKEKFLQLGVEVNSENLRKLLSHYQINYIDELYFRVALGSVDVNSFEDILAEESPIGSSAPKVITALDTKGRKYVIAPCCNPIPGDSVIGFRSPDGTVTVHKKSCVIAEGIASKHGDLVVIPNFSVGPDDYSFPVKISIRGIDRLGLLNEISRYISLIMGVNMKKVVLGAEAGVFEGFIEFYVKDKAILDEIMYRLKIIDGIKEVIRTDI